MDALILSGTSAIRAIRTARRAYSALPWRLATPSEQRAVMRDGTPNERCIDFELLERIGAWEGLDTEQLCAITGDPLNRRRTGQLRCRAITKPLRAGALYRLNENLFCCSPALAALEYSRGRPWQDTFILLMELLGTYTLPPEATLPISWGGYWQDSNRSDNVDQTRCRCDPATTARELRLWARWAQSSAYRPFRQAVSQALPGSASPAESIMCGMLGPPKQYGAFGLSSLPKGGMLLNKKLEFNHDAVLMSSGMPYAICDAYIPSAHVDLEYNGSYHEAASSRLHDEKRNNGLRGMGVKTIVLNHEQMRDVEALEAIARSIYHDAGVRFQYRSNGYRTKQESMLNALRAASGLRPV